MKLINKGVCVGLCACVGLFGFSGCSTVEAEPDFSGVKEIAELSSLECYYHNVVKYHRDSDGFLFGLGSIGEKNMWFEYDGVVKMGLDISQVSISDPDSNGVVTITIPDVGILGHPDIDADSMTDPIEANGWFTGMTAEDKAQALTDAQNNLLTTAENDVVAKARAKERAMDILEQYVKNVGEAIGKTYTVSWAEASAS